MQFQAGCLILTEQFCLHQLFPEPISHAPMKHWNKLVTTCETILCNYFHYNSDAPDLMESVYYPPEKSDLKSHTPKFDIFSLGIVLLEVLTLKLSSKSGPERDNAV